MKIIGIGLNRTGTTSLGDALEILGFNKHMTYNLELTKKYFNGEIEGLLEIAKQHNNLEDWPWPLMYKELFNTFTDAKFVLTYRKSPEAWFKSLCKHTLLKGPLECNRLIYGYSMPHDHSEHFINIYKKHNEEVEKFFMTNAPDKFLKICWENGDGWDELAGFLDKPSPKKPIPFKNKSRKPLVVTNPTLVKVIKKYRKIRYGNK